MDDFSNSEPSVLQRLGQITGRNQVTFYEGSILDRGLLGKVFSEHSFAAVIHFAARKAASESIEQPIAYFDTNISGLLILLQAMKVAGVMRLVFYFPCIIFS